MTQPTHVRAGPVTALLAAFQSAKGAAVSDFPATNAVRLWTAQAPIPAGPEVLGRRWMDSDLGPAIGAASIDPDRPADVLRILASPSALEVLLKSNFGRYPDLPTPHFVLMSQVTSDRWLTLGWVEDVGGVLGDLIRIQDAWVYRLELVMEKPLDRLIALASFAGRKVLLGSAGTTLPDPVEAPDQALFPTELLELHRDPQGVDVILRLRSLRLILDQQAEGDDPHKWDTGTGMYNVRKSGTLGATLEFESDWSDETRAILEASRARTPEAYRLVATSQDGRVLTVDLANVLLKVDPAGHDSLRYLPFRARGRARTDGVNLISISLSAK